jgi:pimeloyl-ACP methyl ester carboxylesterase
MLCAKAAAVLTLVAACPPAAISQRLSDFTAPQPLPPGSVIVLGFLGGFERWNDEQRGVRKVAFDLRSRGIPNLFVETASNHRRRTAVKFLRQALDTNRNGRIDAEEAVRARVILYGQSWGGATVIKTARELQRWGVPVLLTLQVDSVGLSDAVIPANVHAAANFFQHDLLTIRGRGEIRAEDPSRTRIIGNYQFSYYFRHVDESSASWPRRTLGGSHAKMELDPQVWARVEQLILDAIPR